MPPVLFEPTPPTKATRKPIPRAAKVSQSMKLTINRVDPGNLPWPPCLIRNFWKSSKPEVAACHERQYQVLTANLESFGRQKARESNRAINTETSQEVFVQGNPVANSSAEREQEQVHNEDGIDGSKQDIIITVPLYSADSTSTPEPEIGSAAHKYVRSAVGIRDFEGMCKVRNTEVGI
jgi:hypothetical protein